MSNTYKLLCLDCRTSLWIAQGWVYPGDTLEKIQASGRLYATPEHLSALRDFLFMHMEHALQFVESQQVPYDILDKELDDEDEDEAVAHDAGADDAQTCGLVVCDGKGHVTVEIDGETYESVSATLTITQQMGAPSFADSGEVYVVAPSYFPLSRTPVSEDKS